MTRLVKDRTKTLTEEQVGKLWELIDVSRRKDRDFFEICRNARELVKRGHLGELQKLPASDRVVLNLAHAHLKTKAPMLFFREPKAVVKPTHPRFSDKAPIWASLLNNTAAKIGLKKELKAGVRDAITYPEAWIKVGLNLVNEELLRGDVSKPRKEIVGPEIEAGQDKGPVEWLIKGAPFISRLSPVQVIVDYLSKDRSPEGARFIDIMYLKTVGELKADPKYRVDLNAKAVESITGNVGLADQVDPIFSLIDSEKTVGAPEDFVILHEIWVYQLVDLNLYKQLVCLVEVDGAVIKKVARLIDGNIPGWEQVLGADIHAYPLARLVINEIPDEVPNSDIAIVSGIHSCINWLFSRSVQNVDQSKQAFEMITTGVADKDKAKKEFLEGGARYVIEVKQPNTFIPIPNQVIPRDEYNLFNTALEMYRRITGISENKMGGDRFRTATAASEAARSDAIKGDAEIDDIKEWLTTIYGLMARIILNIIKTSGSTDYVFRVVGETGSEEWLRFNSEDVAWLPDIQIEAQSFIKPTKEEEAQKGMMALQAMLQSIPAGVSGRTDVLLRQVFEALEIKDIPKILDNSVDHMLLQAVEVGLMLSGISIPINPNDNHSAHNQVIDMFLNTPYAEEAQSKNPVGFDLLLQHRNQHEQALKEMEGGLVSAGTTSNIFEQVSMPTEANMARAYTAKEREATSTRIPGGGGLL